MKTLSRLNGLTALFLLALVPMSPAHADKVVWDFNLPATGLESQNPPYPSLGLLTLEDSSCGIIDCVKFTFDPNEANPGYTGNPSTVDRLTIAFSTSAGDGLHGDPGDQNYHQLTSIAGMGMVDVDSWLWSQAPPPADDNLDAGYTTGEGQFTMIWDNPNFPVSAISMWTILNTTIAGNFSIMGTANNKPSPTFGVLSVTPKIVVQDADGNNVNPTPSNWVTGPSPVPVPAAVWLFGSALLGLVGFGRKRQTA